MNSWIEYEIKVFPNFVNKDIRNIREEESQFILVPKKTLLSKEGDKLARLKRVLTLLFP